MLILLFLKTFTLIVELVNRREDIKRSKIPLKQQKRCFLRGVKTTHNKNKKFIATITVKGQHIVLGKCHTEEEAGRLYDR